MSIYLDYASITPIDRRVARVFKKYSGIEYMNPSSMHTAGVMAKRAVDLARNTVATSIGAHADEIVFTGSGTEANNIALLGISTPISHIMVSAIEHSSVLEPARILNERGVDVTYIPVDANGLIDLEFLKKNLRRDTALVSVMMVNNEIGTIEPIKEIVKIVRDHRKTTGANTLVHTDACQAPISESISMEKLGVDLMTLDGHKIYGPRGIGMLYVRRGVNLNPIVYGGGQEKGLRSGTENVPAIMGFAEAIKSFGSKDTEYILKLKNTFLDTIKKDIPEVKVNGGLTNTAPHILNIEIPGIDSEFFVLKLDARGVYASTKSSCLRDEDESYVLKSIGGKSSSSIRFSFGKSLKNREVKKAARIVVEIAKKSLT
jgi:cysteine desulfurase